MQQKHNIQNISFGEKNKRWVSSYGDRTVLASVSGLSSNHIKDLLKKKKKKKLRSHEIIITS